MASRDKQLVELYTKVDDILGVMLELQKNQMALAAKSARSLELNSGPAFPSRSATTPRNEARSRAQPKAAPPTQGATTLHTVMRVQPSQEEALTWQQMYEIIKLQVKELQEEKKKTGTGKPYPEYHDQVPYPRKSSVPKFKTFNGIGNPYQHIAHFKASYGDTATNGLLLLKQFVPSLTRIAFELYVPLPDNSVQIWVEMVWQFTNRFTSGSDRINVVDLVSTQRKDNEEVLDYTRWHNLSTKRYNHSMDPALAIGVLVGNIKHQMCKNPNQY